MGNFVDDLGGPGRITEGLQDVEQTMSGQAGERAALEAALIQEAFAREALGETAASQLRLEETLAPFVGFGRNVIPEYQNLFGADVASSIAASPTISDLQAMGSQAVASNPFLASLNPAGLQSAQLVSGIPLLSRERSDLLSAIGLGQASAAQEAAGNLQTGANRADLLAGIGNVQASGLIGGQQARAQGAQNAAAAGTAIASFLNRNRG